MVAPLSAQPFFLFMDQEIVLQLLTSGGAVVVLGVFVWAFMAGRVISSETLGQQQRQYSETLDKQQEQHKASLDALQVRYFEQNLRLIQTLEETTKSHAEQIAVLTDKIQGISDCMRDLTHEIAEMRRHDGKGWNAGGNSAPPVNDR